MKTYLRHKNFSELRSAVLELGWTFDHAEYDKGSDRVMIRFADGAVRGTVFVSLVNGTFFGDLSDGTYFNERSTRYEKQAWYKGLLNVIFTNKSPQTIKT